MTRALIHYLLLSEKKLLLLYLSFKHKSNLHHIICRSPQLWQWTHRMVLLFTYFNPFKVYTATLESIVLILLIQLIIQRLYIIRFSTRAQAQRSGLKMVQECCWIQRTLLDYCWRQMTHLWLIQWNQFNVNENWRAQESMTPHECFEMGGCGDSVSQLLGAAPVAAPLRAGRARAWACQVGGASKFVENSKHEDGELLQKSN